ncbi:MAG: hypothetical protein GX298_00275 [Planctomycetes bacterium]|jgi:hypothetical protein|nr:hypothetical protein [Planctomycetota bacterium]
MFKRHKKQYPKLPPLAEELIPEIRVYPSQHSCVRLNMNHVKPEQLPPLMVRKAAWRR